MDILHNFCHGLGDAVMFTAVLRHLKKYRSDWCNNVVARKGNHSAFHGLAGATAHDTELPGDQKFDHDWPECWDSWSNSPGTKTVRCLREKFGIQPDWDLLKYEVQVGENAKKRVVDYIKTLPSRPFALIHYEGNTSKSQKDLRHEDVGEVCSWLNDKGITPVILDWDGRSPLPDQWNIFCPDVHNPLWMSYGTGDAETLVALIKQAALFVGIDSGPCKAAFATSTPTVAVWVEHHPYHYCDNAPNAVHVVPYNHCEYIRGNSDVSIGFFEDHYEYVCYRPGQVAGYIKQQCAKFLGVKYNPMPDSSGLTSVVFAEKYYEQHKRAGLDYLGHGEWQEKYGRWFVESLELQGKVMLDVGCACGSIAAGLAKAGALVSGCDVNEHMINLGRQHWLRDQLKICDACNLHYWADETFHFIHSAQVFEHFKPELVPHILTEVHRVTKPGGVMFVCLDTKDLYERQGRVLANEDPTHTCIKPMVWWHAMLDRTSWMPDYDLAERLKKHSDNYFKRYDWDWFIVRK